MDVRSKSLGLLWVVISFVAAACGPADNVPMSDGGDVTEAAVNADATPADAANPDIGSVDPGCGALPPARITAANLFAEMVDLERLTLDPAIPYVTHLASSYDRNSVSPTADGWFANADASGFVRVDGNEHVMLDVTGPGAITRVWSANPTGTIRIYLDGATAPTIETSFAELFAGHVGDFVQPFAYSAARGQNLIYPIPFARSVRVTSTESTLYYQIDYRLYEAGTAVESFVPNAPLDALTACYRERAAHVLAGARPVKQANTTFVLDTAADGDVVIPASGEGSEIVSFTIVPGRLDASALRRTVLTMTFDGERTVNTPLGDFFAYGAGSTDVSSLAVEAHSTGSLTMRLPMPFAHEARVRLTDAGGGALRADASIDIAPRAFDAATSMYFHSHWTGASSFSVMTPRDWRVANITGRGYYVGTILHVGNPDSLWWGEGDEKMYVDGESFPSHFGTGTEDFFTYAWCDTERFSNAYSGQTRANETNFAGFTWLYRYHIVDAIPFESSFVFDLETLHWQTGQMPVEMQYDAVYQFYAGPGATVAGDHDLAPADCIVPELPAGIVETGSGARSC